MSETVIEKEKVIEFIPDEFKKWLKLVTSKALSTKWGEALFKLTYRDLEITIEEYFQGYKGSDEEATLSKEEIHMFELNSKAWCYIESAVKNDPGAYGIVNAIDNRNAFKAWSLLKMKYDKTGDAVDMTQLETDWNNCKMESDLSDPDVWFNELTNIRNMIKEVAPAIVKNDTTTALKIVANLPACYMSVHSSLIQTQSTGDLEIVKNCVRAHYKAFIKGKNPDQIAMVNYTPPAERKMNRR